MSSMKTGNLKAMNKELDLTVQIATSNPNCPDTETICNWVSLALARDTQPAEITVRIVDEEECAELNQRYRNREGATNVLSFPYESVSGSGQDLFGDIVICAPVVEREAREQNKNLQSHWAHMVIHGTLHLMGYNHIKKNEAETMESLERSLMTSLGYADPYLENQP